MKASLKWFPDRAKRKAALHGQGTPQRNEKPGRSMSMFIRQDMVQGQW